MQELIRTIYVPFSSTDEDWGLHILDVGKSRTPAGFNYPVGPHPPEYIFNFNQGRVLSEYQILYINEGEGEFESELTGKVDVETGSVIMLYPGIWHRYRPNKSIGWNESWIGFNGKIADHILGSSFFSKENPVIKVGLHSRLNELYDQVLADCREGEPGYQQVAAGLVMELLGLIHMLRKSSMLNSQYIQSKIYKSRIIIEEKFKSEIYPEKIAEMVDMGYSNFRKQFRLYTGLSPVQYIIQLRIREAKVLLYRTNMSVKEIAAEAGFKSSYYFIRLFKDKVGMTPGSFRQTSRGNLV